MCRLLQVSRSGYYARCAREDSNSVKRDRELAPLVSQLHQQSGGVYGARKIHHDLIEMGERLEALGIEYIPALRLCPWSPAMFHHLDTHPNRHGYQNIADCVRKTLAL